MKTRVLGALALGASVVPMFAADPVTLPDTGIDMASYINAAITGLGVIVGAAVLGYFAFLLIKKGLKWSGKLGG